MWRRIGRGCGAIRLEISWLPKGSFAYKICPRISGGVVMGGRLGFWRPLLAAMWLMCLAGCGQPIPPPDTATANQMKTQFADGNANLSCKTMGCAGNFGGHRALLQTLYGAQDWPTLAQQVMLLNEDQDLSWFYLAMAAENLGDDDAAQTYYFDSLASGFRCAHPINTCDGFDLPTLTFSRLDHLNEVIEASAEFTQLQAPPVAPKQPVTIGLIDKPGYLAAPAILDGKIPLLLAVDSGSTGVNISVGVAAEMLHAGVLKKTDILGRTTVQMGNGDIVPIIVVRLEKLQVGGIVITNVLASVSDGRAPSLLGQTFLHRFKSWSIDYGAKSLALRP